VVWMALACALFLPALRSVWAMGIIAAFLHAFVDYPFARFGLTAWNFALIGALMAGQMREVGSRQHIYSSGKREENCT
jgi:hypothetical protein